MKNYGIYVNGNLVCTVPEISEQKALEFAEKNSEEYAKAVSGILSNGMGVTVTTKKVQK